MNLLTVNLTVSNPVDDTKKTNLDFIIDTGASFSVVPENLLNLLKIKPKGEEVFILANGKKIKRKVGTAKFEYGSNSVTSTVVFGRKNDIPVLGISTLALIEGTFREYEQLNSGVSYLLFSGHSRWHGIKHKKMAVDAQRGKLFTKLIREITVAAREKGSNPDTNPALRRAIEAAREANMPQENIKRAIMRGIGELPGEKYEEVLYEGYGPGGVAMIIDVITDNKNRTTAEIRKIITKYNGNLGTTGCVSWMFSQKGYISIDKSCITEDEITDLVLELGAEDLKTDEEDIYEITTSPEDFERIKQELSNRNLRIKQAEITMMPKTYIKLTGKEAEQMLALMNELEEHDDVKNVYANFDIPTEVMEKVSVAI